LRKIPIDIIELINKVPNKFILLQVLPGHFGSIVYRAIAGSDPIIYWDRKYAGSDEDLQPLEWPHGTEGFKIYDVKDITYNIFKENHLATAHISKPLLENSWFKDIVTDLRKNKVSLIKTHDEHIHESLTCKIIRVVGDHNSACLYTSPFMRTSSKSLSKVNKNNIHNLDISYFLNEDFDIFLNEYLKMTAFLDINVNINNVRQFILLHKDKMRRYNKNHLKNQ